MSGKRIVNQRLLRSPRGHVNLEVLPARRDASLWATSPQNIIRFAAATHHLVKVIAGLDLVSPRSMSTCSGVPTR